MKTKSSKIWCFFQNWSWGVALGIKMNIWGMAENTFPPVLFFFFNIWMMQPLVRLPIINYKMENTDFQIILKIDDFLSL